jgi:photosystem II stability/assembly factor-like uncharacterized protein
MFVQILPGQAQWKPLGPFGGPIQSVAIDPHHPDTVLAATATGLLFLSRTGGDTWVPSPFPAQLRGVLHTLLADLATPHTYFAAVSSEFPECAGVFRSGDDGATWEQLPGMREHQVWSLAASPADPSLIAAGTEQGLFITHDRGESWQPLSLSEDVRVHPIVSIAFHPSARDTIYVGTPHLAWKTVDGGGHWTPLSNGMRDDSDVFSIVVDRRRPTRVFAGACSGLYRSLNGGASWLKLDGPDRTYVVAQHPVNPNIFYAGTSSGMFQSRDGGMTWRSLSAHVVRGIAFDFTHASRIVFASDDAGVLRSSDGGGHVLEANQGLCTRHFSPLSESGGAIVASVLGEKTRRPIIVVPADGARRTIYTLAGETLLRSFDAGRTWNPVSTPGDLTAFARSLGIAETLVVATPAGLFGSDDGGLNWEAIPSPPLPAPVRDILPLSSSALAAIAGSRLLLSKDGREWKVAAPIPEIPVIRGVASGASGRLLVATSAGIMHSDDFGSSWQRSGSFGGSGVQAIACSAEPRHACFAAVVGVVYESLDNGESWQPVAPESAVIGPITQLLAISGEPQRLLALTEARGVFELERNFQTAEGASARAPK